MSFIDTHAHVYLPEFDTGRDQMLKIAREEGIVKVFMPAVDSSTHNVMIRSEEESAGICFSMMGLHPCSVKPNYTDELKMVTTHFENRSFIAVGEIGLDFYWDLTFTEQQYKAFHEQIELALHFDIPIVIHSRNSIDECIKVVTEHQQGKLKGVFHCFSGDLEQAKQIIDLNFYLGIGGVVTFKNSGLDRIMKEIELKNVVLETDAPYLAPVPFRGKRNECSYIKYIAAKLAGIKEMGVDEVGNITTANAEKLFRL